MQKVISLAKRRGFIFPGSEIYGGLANSFDYGPMGTELKNNIKQEWWKRFVHQREDVVGIDAALIMNTKVWEASGHIATFSDPLVECRKCHERFRSDQLPAMLNTIRDENPNLPKDMFSEMSCPVCNQKNSFTEPKQFNLMLKTYLGPVDPEALLVRYAQSTDEKEKDELKEIIEKSRAYFRPETAQAMFVNFKNIIDTSHYNLPFGIAQIGKAFRNEITPGNFIFRMREFEQMEIEYFVKEAEWEKYFKHWLDEMKTWLKDLGISSKKLHFVDIPDGERAHYSKKTIDIEYDYPFGQKELYGLAYRGDFDLKSHFVKDAPYRDADTGEAFWPHVIEPTWGVDRTLLAVMLEAYYEEKAPTARSTSSGQAEEGESATRVVMKFPAWLSPVKVAVLPLVKNKPKVTKKAKEVFNMLAPHFTCQYDETASIGKRYRRQDEIGTPYCVTIDFDSLENNDVTIRDRDTMKQERVSIDNLKATILKRLYDTKN